MHKLLERQLRKHQVDLDVLPAAVRAVLRDVSDAYEAADTDRQLVERSLEMASQELIQRNLLLLESEARYRRIVETATEGIWLTDMDGRITFANDRMGEIIGCNAKDLAGRSMMDFIELPEDAAARADGTLETLPTDYRLKRMDGATGWAIISSARLTDASGRDYGGLAMFTDITARKQAELEVRRAFEQLKELDRLRSLFINNAAHELGTPLTPIKLQVHLLRTAYWNELPPSHQKTIRILERNVERLSQLVGDILDAAKLQSGRLNLRFQKAPLAPMVRDATESFQAAAVHKGITLEVAAEAGLECHVDPRRLGQILYNLLTNALKFTAPAGTINVVVRRIGRTAQIIVRDTGRGIDPVNLVKLFQPFSQVHDTMQVTAPGTGLGLYISRGMAEQMGGQLWCESAGLGKGTSFFVELPLAQTRRTRDQTTAPEQAV